jgi:NAD+ diphosphatase
MKQPALARSTVDRCSASRTDQEWLRNAWAVNGRVLVLDAELQAPVEAGEPAEEPILAWRQAAPAWGSEPPADAVLLGADETGAFWALDRPAAQPEDGEIRLAHKGLRDIGQLLPPRDSGLFTHAVAVLTWHRSHTHCPRCGARTEPAQAGAVRVCTNDGSEHFPRVDPAMIVLVCSPDRAQAVLGRGTNWPHPFFSCLAGFVEPGESAEQSVIREVAEEVGIAVRDVRYSGSQPWPFPSSLMLGFTAIADVGELYPQPSELAAAAWFTREEVVSGLATRELGLPSEVSIARALIDDWLNGAG